MRVDRGVLERLEWGRILAAIEEQLRTEMGRVRVRGLGPLEELQEIEALQARVEEMRRLQAEKGRLPFAEIQDPSETIAALGIARRALAGAQIYAVLELLIVARDLAGIFRQLDPACYPEFGAEWARFPDLSVIIESIEGNLNSEGELEDRASAELGRLRREIRQLSERLTGVLDKLIKAEWTQPVLRDRFITVRNNRYVLPVRSDTPRRFHGIVHGRSSTEKTLFVEPLETVEINNQLVRLRDAEAAEVERILAAYTELLRGCRGEIAVCGELLGELDQLGAVAAWADQVGACRPELDPQGGLHLLAARHPVLDATISGARSACAMVPLDIDLPRDLRVLVISGPNAGGKTVALKTIGLLTLMAHAGLPLPARAARLPAFARLLADIGDEQSIEDGLSTFSSHIHNLAAMLEASTPPALVLIDEIGTGTDPAEGAALGVAVLERLLARGVHVIATTHHQAIKTWAYRADGVLNAACEFDEQTLRPTYRLVAGVAGASIGLTMAEQLGLDAEVVAAARRRLDPAGEDVTRALESVRGLASELEKQRAELAGRRRELEAQARHESQRLREKEARRQEQWAGRMDELMRAFRKEASRMISKVKDLRDRRALDRERARRERELKESFSEELRAGRQVEPAPADWTPREGEQVLVVTLSREGSVQRTKKGQAEVRLGRSLFTVALSDLRPVTTGERLPVAAPRRRPEVPEGVSLGLSDKVVSAELHLIGFRVEEALCILEKYFDDALLAGHAQVRIIHGLGTGRLRTAVRERLDAHPGVLSWREAEQREGGAGATVVSLEVD